MGMKANSTHFYSNETAGGESRRESKFPFKLNLQLFASNKPDPKMPKKGKRLYNAVNNHSLQNQIVELYRPGATIGDGGTADCVREEIRTGKPTHGKFHFIKAEERISALTKIMNTCTLSPGDRKIAQRLIDDLTDALKGRKK